MICPHCGNSTKSKNLCEYCGNSTEFIVRSNIQPETIPGMEMNDVRFVHEAFRRPEEQMVKLGKEEKNYNFWKVFAVILAAMLIVAILWLVILYLSREEPQLVETTEPSVSQTELIPKEEVSPEPLVIFDRNMPQKQEVLENLSVIRFGETIPELPDVENYIFLGWNTDPTGKGTSFLPGETFMISLAEDLVLYGQWQPDTDISVDEDLSEEAQDTTSPEPSDETEPTEKTEYAEEI